MFGPDARRETRLGVAFDERELATLVGDDVVDGEGDHFAGPNTPNPQAERLTQIACEVRVEPFEQALELRVIRRITAELDIKWGVINRGKFNHRIASVGEGETPGAPHRGRCRPHRSRAWGTRTKRRATRSDEAPPHQARATR